MMWLLWLVACSMPSPAPSWRTAVAEWHYEDPLPDVPLIDHTGTARSLAQFRGQHLLIGFIYTACPDAAACPMTTARMASIQRRLPEAPAPLHLLSLTLDPARDTPETLTAYAQTHGVDLQTWTFATGEPALMIDGLPSLFNVLSLPDADGTLDHTIKLVLLDPSGRQVAEWKDNVVTADDVFRAMAPSP
ncbi:MAG: protein SCO1/2 [Myxococcota bacterium]|jgi:protein SCO1/2